MKFSKIFMLAATALIFSACAEKEEWNTTEGATVSVAQATLRVSEAQGLFQLPITVTGERNAPIQVTVEVKSAEATEKTLSAEEDVHYMVTSKVINISNEDNGGNIEIKAIDDAEINYNREFEVTIISVNGATLDQENNTTLVTLKDNDSNPYDRLAGAWQLQIVSDYDGPMAWNVNVITDTEGGDAYEKYTIVTGLSGYEFMTARLDYSYNAETEEGYVAFTMPYVSVEGVNFGSFIGDIHLYGITEDNKVMTSDTSIKGVWNEDMTEITFEATPKFGMLIVVDGQLYSWWERCVIAKMVKN